MTVQCSVVTEGVQCPELFTSNEALHKDVRFICKNHPRKSQVETAGRNYYAITDERDSEDRFQTSQFDKQLSGRRGKQFDHGLSGKLERRYPGDTNIS